MESLAPIVTANGSAGVTIAQADVLLDDETVPVDVQAVRDPLETALRWSA